jgi:hypothetical protein
MLSLNLEFAQRRDRAPFLRRPLIHTVALARCYKRNLKWGNRFNGFRLVTPNTVERRLALIDQQMKPLKRFHWLL